MTKENLGVDILGFDVVTPCETAHDLMMLKEDDMTETGITFQVLGAHADVVKAHFKEKTKAYMTKSSVAEKQGKTDEFTGKLIDSKEQNEIEGAAIRVVGWDAKQDFSKQLLKQVLAKNPHWIGQIVKFSENIGNFTK